HYPLSRRPQTSGSTKFAIACPKTWTTAVIVWTRCNPALLDLPLFITARILTSRASGPAFARKLTSRAPCSSNPPRAPIELLVDQMRSDGRPFLVHLDLGGETPLIHPASLARLDDALLRNS